MTTRSGGQALLVVDVQQSLVDALDERRRAQLSTVVRGLIDRARGSGTPIVYIQHEDADDAEFRRGTPGWEIAADIQPRQTDTVVAKRFRDAFRETLLAQVLEELGVRELIVCGMQTEYCVDATVREAERRGYRVTLVADGHATFAAGGLSEEQIRGHIHRVTRDTVAAIVPAAGIAFAPAMV